LNASASVCIQVRAQGKLSSLIQPEQEVQCWC
jgi:hypothetical protein